MANHTADTDWIDCHALRREAQTRGNRGSESASDGLGVITLSTQRCTTLRLIEPDGSETEIPVETAAPEAKPEAKEAARLKAAEAEAAAKALEEELDRREDSDGLVVVALENFDHLLSSIFGERQTEERLRKWLTRKNNRIMLLATATGTVDTDYDRPLSVKWLCRKHHKDAHREGQKCR